MSKKIFFSFILTSILSTAVTAQMVTNASELNSAINSATPGSTIILADGIWNNVFIDIDKNGSADNPITITSQNPGSVLMTGNSRVYMEGSYLTVSGLVFQDAENLIVDDDVIEPVFELRRCDNCKIINNKIDGYNGTEAQKTLKFKWILADGQNNEIAFNSFLNKWGVGSIINDNRNSTEPDYLRIHHNYFAGRRPINELNEDNDQDAIRIGNSGTSLFDSFTEVYDNYFYDHAGEIEVISNKSGQNKYYNNTFRDYSGTLTLRHGNNCEVYNNFFFADDNYSSGGVRVIGEGHKIYNNYIEGINSFKPSGSSSNATGGINVSNGREDTELNGYFQVKNTEILHNTFVNCDYALRIGTQVKDDLFLEPENLVVANNITYNTSLNHNQIITEPSGNSISEGNVFELADSDVMDNGSLHVLTNVSPAIGAAEGNYPYVIQDILGATRDAFKDAGAEEYGANGSRLPYEAEDVGTFVGFGAVSNSIDLSTDALNFGVCGSSISFDLITSVEWTIENDLSWVSFDITSGSGSARITATTIENESGADRIGDIIINEVAGGDDASALLSVVQSMISIPLEIPIQSTTSMGTQDIPEVSEENAYNDDLSNYWTGNPDTETEVSITFDLGDSFLLTDIGIFFWKADERSTTFSMEIAEDADGPFTTVLDNHVSADSGVTGETEQIFSLSATTGRYVKFIGHGNSSSTNWTSIANVNIYGDIDCDFIVLSNDDKSELIDDITLFPNPSLNGVLNISSESKPIEKIEIYSVTGKKVFTTDGNGRFSTQLDIKELDSGVYLVKLKGIGLVRFIKA